MEESGFGSCQENDTCWTAMCQGYSKVHKDMEDSLDVDELDWPIQIPDLNLREHLCDQLERTLRARSSPRSENGQKFP